MLPKESQPSAPHFPMQTQEEARLGGWKGTLPPSPSRFPTFLHFCFSAACCVLCQLLEKVVSKTVLYSWCRTEKVDKDSKGKTRCVRAGSQEVSPTGRSGKAFPQGTDDWAKIWRRRSHPRTLQIPGPEVQMPCREGRVARPGEWQKPSETSGSRGRGVL